MRRGQANLRVREDLRARDRSLAVGSQDLHHRRCARPTEAAEGVRAAAGPKIDGVECPRPDQAPDAVHERAPTSARVLEESSPTEADRGQWWRRREASA